MGWFQNWLEGKPLVDSDEPRLRFDVELPEHAMWDPERVQQLVAPSLQVLQAMVTAEPLGVRMKWLLIIGGFVAMIAGLMLLVPSLGDMQPDPSLLGCFLYAGGATTLLLARSWEDRESIPSDPVGMARRLIGLD